jgi:hypothetical protein
MRASHMAPLSDHVDYYDLHEMIAAMAPSRVWAVHGPYSELFALDVMRRHGIPASTLESE